MSTTAERAFSTAVRNSSKYFGSVEGNTGLQGSILWMLNFSATCAAKSFSSILCAGGTGPGELPSHPFHPTMNSRKGYAATAIRSRGAAGNWTDGSDFAAACARAGISHVPAVAPALCARNCLRVVGMRRQCTRAGAGWGKAGKRASCEKIALGEKLRDAHFRVRAVDRAQRFANLADGGIGADGVDNVRHSVGG